MASSRSVRFDISFLFGRPFAKAKGLGAHFTFSWWRHDMYMNKCKLLFVSGLLMMNLTAVAIDSEGEEDTQSFTDVRQETQIWTTYALSPHLRAHDIKVFVHNGKAILTGKVDELFNINKIKILKIYF